MNLKEFFYTIKIIRQTRNIQEFLWGKLNISWGLEEWKRMFTKRAHKIVKIDTKNPHWKIELRKRLLQNACLSLSLLGRLDTLKDGISNVNIPSNLEKYEEMTNDCKNKP